MRNDKYFYPKIEDLYVGYECERNTDYTGWVNTSLDADYFTTALALNAGFNLAFGDKVISSIKIRTPYLTQEQIEKEGWRCRALSTNGCSIFIKNGINSVYELIYKGTRDIPIYNISISEIKPAGMLPMNPEFIITGIECKDINTFRKIIKLLNI